MKCKILHTSPGRVRVHMMQNRMTLEQADILEYYLLSIPGITSAKVYDRTCDAVIVYTANRQTVLDALGAFSYEKHAGFVPEQTGRTLNRECEERLIMTVLSRMAMKVLLPNPLHTAVTWYTAASYIKKGLSALLQGKVDVALLDATAITVSLLRNDHDTASSIMFLLKVGEILEDWTHKKSVDDLARAMSLNIDQVWLKVDGKEVSVPVDRVSVGDYVVVRTGSMIPLDGTIVEGEAMINQASMTGEPLPVAKRSGSYVYAGTVVEEGKETKVINGKKYVLELPLRANVALVKCHTADKMGNAVFRYTAQNFNPLMAMAADYVVLECEHLVEVGEIEPDRVQLPGVFVDAVVLCEEVIF